MMKGFAYFIALFGALAASAQNIQVNDNYTAQQLADALVSNSCAQVSNVVVNGWTGGAGGPSFGYFTAGASSFPFANGIVLSTGFAASAPGPNNSLLSEGNTSWGGDQDLEEALNVSGTINATVLEFDFTPFTSHISFEYIFASEQYLTSINSPNQCNYTDGFAFLLKKANSADTYTNLAVVPGTEIPVRVNTVRGTGVCPAANEQYFDAFNPANAPINFNGQTVILTAESDVEAGQTYHIKLVIADQGNNLYDSAIFLGGGSFNTTLDIGPDRLIATNNPLCHEETLELDASYNGATGWQWFRNNAPLNGETNATYLADEEGDYTVEVSFGPTCVTTGEIKLEYTAPLILGNYTLLQCDDNNDGFTTFNLEQAGQLAVNGDPNLEASGYFLSGDGTNPISNYNAFQNTAVNQVIYVGLRNRFNCSGIASVTLSVSNNTVTDPAPLEECDTDGTDDGIFNFDLTTTAAEILATLPPGLQVKFYPTYNDALTFANPVTDPSNFANTTAGTQVIYARINSGSDCYGIAEVNLIVHAFGDGFDDEKVILCDDDASITLDPGAYSSYTWDTDPVQTTRSITVDAPGNYTVTATNAFGCEGSKTFTVIPSGRATGATFEIKEFTGNNNSITIQPEGIGTYEYSINGIDWQESPVFTRLPQGEYLVFIRDANGCGPMYTDNVFILDYPLFFTPNGDGINDTWRIPYSTQRPGIFVTVFDRYGKIITGFKGNEQGWDGTYNGTPLPATDYWFVIELENGKRVRGHFAMLR
ncbi:T9SS type B sorting domain-containing protein [uncultured Flavobacterium sp.]|uniref:T9SS type B sorting domain-containing protein n=1 Tax=uncultured Flavobacterium sp. TaxID=165435 RepID=UPI0025FC84AC|nr:choice-of-anchor L domain-containing protein [uncultured Flavobacterium sp.]